MDYVIREFEIRPVHGRHGTKVSGVKYFILGPQGFE